MTLALYTFVRNNPLHFTDPDGQDALPDPEAGPKYKADFQKAKARLMKTKAGRELFKELKKKPDFFVGPNANKEDPLSGTSFVDKKPVVSWASRFGMVTREKGEPTGSQSPAISLLHELEHALSFLENPDTYPERSKQNPDQNAPYSNPDDEQIIKGPETSAAKQLGKGTRDTDRGYKSDFFPVEGPTQGGKDLTKFRKKK